MLYIYSYKNMRISIQKRGKIVLCKGKLFIKQMLQRESLESYKDLAENTNTVGEF